jgi:hypothetical protein
MEEAPAEMSAIFSAAARQYQACRAEYEQYLDGVYLAAEEATRGALLNARGRRARIDPRSLMMGTEARALAYASPELVEYWQDWPRLTYTEFERQWVEGA